MRVKSKRPGTMCFAETVVDRACGSGGTAQAALAEYTGRGGSSLASIYIVKRASTQTLERRSRVQRTAAATIIKGDLGQPRDPARFASLQGIGADAHNATNKGSHDTSIPCPSEGTPRHARARFVNPSLDCQ